MGKILSKSSEICKERVTCKAKKDAMVEEREKNIKIMNQEKEDAV